MCHKTVGQKIIIQALYELLVTEGLFIFILWISSIIELVTKSKTSKKAKKQKKVAK